MKQTTTILLSALLCILLISGISQAQPNFNFSSGTTTYTVLTGASTFTWNYRDALATNTNDEQYTSPTDIGFTFTYLGKTYTKFQASTNGFISLGSELTNSLATNALNGTIRNIIAPLWDDFMTDSVAARSTIQNAAASITYILSGSAPNRVMTVEWKNMLWPFNDINVASKPIQFQMKIYETTNVIEYIYGSSPVANVAGTRTASIGLSDGTPILTAGQATGTFMSINVGGVAGARKYHRSMGYEFSGIISVPDSGTVLSFTPFTPTPIASGTYTVGGSSPNYASPSDAAIDLNLRGITGPVTFNIAPGTYDDVLHLINVQGTSTSNTITMQSGGGGSVTLSPLNGSVAANPPNAVTGDAFIRLDGTQYATISGLNLVDNALNTTTAKKFEAGIFISNSIVSSSGGIKYSGARFNIIKNDTINMNATVGATAAGSIGIRFGPNGLISDTGATLSYNTIKDVMITNFYRAGIYFGGYTGANPNVGNRVTASVGNKNYIGDVTVPGSSDVRAIEAYEEKNFTVEHTTIKNLVMNSTGGGNGTNGIWFNPASSAVDFSSGTILFDDLDISNVQVQDVGATTALSVGIRINRLGDGTNIIIRNSKIYNIYCNASTTGRADGILLDGGFGTGIVNAQIYNNYVYDIRAPRATAAPAPRGLDLQAASGGAFNAQVYHNTIYLDNAVDPTATNHSSAAIYWANYGTSFLDLRNNIVVNTMAAKGTGFAPALYASASTNLIRMTASSNNNLYSTGATPSTAKPVSYNASSSFVTVFNHKNALLTGGLGGPRETRSVYEVPPFTSSVSPYNLVINPATATRIQAGAQPISGTNQENLPLTITTDINGNVRDVNTPDIGAEEGSFSFLDGVGPKMGYIPLTTASVITPPTFSNVTITDPSGVAIAAGSTAPRFYFKKGILNNTFNDNTNVTVGWKFVEASGITSPFSFTPDYSLVGGVNAGDTLYYFVIAQDLASTPNVSMFNGSLTTAPTSVVLSSTHFPTLGVQDYVVVGGTASTLNGTIDVGSGLTYTSLTGNGGLFQAINAGTLSGNVTVKIHTDLTESGQFDLQQWKESGVGGYTLTIIPADTATVPKVVTGLATNGLIRFNGADRLKIDGRPLGTGSSKFLLFRNTSTNGPTIMFYGDATNNTVQYATIEGAATTFSATTPYSTSGGSAGVVYFGYGITTGNDNNTITFCDIRDRSDATGYPFNGIYSLGTIVTPTSIIADIDVVSGISDRKTKMTSEEISPIPSISNSKEQSIAAAMNSSTLNNSSITVSNCNIYNFWSTSATSVSGILLDLGNTNWTISGNSFYQTASRSQTNAVNLFPIRAVDPTSEGLSITNNYIGGQSSQCGGTALTMSGATSHAINAIRLTAAASSASSIQGNVIKNISISSTPSAGQFVFVGIMVFDGFINIGDVNGNIIGDSSATGSISLTSAGASANVAIGIQFQGTNGSIMKNVIGGITVANASTGALSLYGINVTSNVINPFVISNNLIGSKTVSGSINHSTVANAVGFIGIASGSLGVATVSGNTISNILIPSTNTLSTVWGIYHSGTGNASIINNNINNLSSGSANPALAGGGTAVAGILYGGSSGAGFGSGGQISNNSIYTLSLTNAAAVQNNIVGISITNPTHSVLNGNLIYDLRNASTMAVATTPPVVAGVFYRASGAYSRVVNNIIRLGDLQTGNIQIIGLWNNFSTSGVWQIYNNSVSISGTVTTGALPSFGLLRGDNSAAPAIYTPVNIKNNIFYNSRSGGTGKHYALGNQASTLQLNGWLSTASDNNILYTATAGTLGRWGATDYDFASWKSTTGGDINSQNLDPQFVSASDLHINPNASSPASNNGIALADVTTDYDGDVRNTTNPDIGADEFAGNVATASGTIKGGSYGDLTVIGAATLSGSIDVKGILTLNATLGVGANTLTLNNPIGGAAENLTTDATSSIIVKGTSAAVTIPAAAAQVNNLTVNNTNGISLAGNLTVNGTTTFISGKIFTNAFKIKTLTPVVGANATSFVSGYQSQLLTNGSAKKFEVGQGSDYLPLTATVTTSGSDYLTAVVLDKSVTAPAGLLGGGKVLNRYYRLQFDNNLKPFTASLILSYKDADVLAVSADETKLRVFQWNGSSWIEPSITSRDANANTITVSGVVGDGDFILASTPLYSTWWGKSIDFGFIDIKNMVIDTLYVKNSGSEAMNISSVLVSDANFTVLPGTAGPIATGDSAKFIFTYDPSIPGVLNTQARFIHDGITSPDTIVMTGKSEYPVYSASQPSISFGDVALNVAKKDSIVIKNTATVAKLNITTVSSTSQRYIVSPTAASINAGDSVKFYVSFTPITGSTENGYVIFENDGIKLKDSLGVNGKGALPGFTTSKRVVDFGNVAINTTKNDTVLVWNSSISALNVDSVKLKSPYFNVIPMNKIISSGDTARFQFSFSPLINGDFSDTVVFYHNASSLQDTIVAKGFGVAPAFVANKVGIINLGNVRVGKTTKDSIIVTNATIATLKIDSIKVIGSGDYTALPVFGTAQPQGTFGTSVLFAPSVLGSRNGGVVFYHNGISKIDTINYTGVGVLPNFLALSTNKQFGSVVVATTKSDTMYVKNTGTDSLTITSITSNSTEFTVVTPSMVMSTTEGKTEALTVITEDRVEKKIKVVAGEQSDELPVEVQKSTDGNNTSIVPTTMLVATQFTVKPSDSARIIIRFTPTSTGVKNGKLFFTHDSPKGADTIQLGGTGVQATFSINPTVLVIKSQLIGQSKKDSVTVSNFGTSTLTISGVTSSSTEFSISPLTATVDTGKTQKFYLTFAPSSAGLRSAKITFAHNGATKDTLSVSSTGIAVGTIRLARNAVNGTEVAFDGIVTRVKGAYTYMQDDSAGIIIYQSSGIYKDTVANGYIKKGDKIRIFGKTSEFNSLKEIAATDLISFSILTHNNTMPKAKLVTLKQLVTGGEAYEAQLIRVTTLSIISTDTVFAAAKTYSINDPSDTTKAVVLRTPNATDGDVDGLVILKKPVVFTGVLSQFSSSNPAAGYQLMAIDSADVMDNVLIVTNPMDLVPTEYQLAQNYPNPFNPSTTIQYGIPQQSTVTVKIYSILGQEVKTLVNDVQSPSYYRVIWNGTDNNGNHLSSGVYFIRITAEASDAKNKPFIQVKKMLLMK